MRISDWSSDVCSSDLVGEREVAVRAQAIDAREFGEAAFRSASGQHRHHVDGLADQRAGHGHDGFLDELLHPAQRAERRAGVNGADAAGMAGAPGLEEVERSEEHTSELQSLMRSSYAVFCLTYKEK